MACQPPAKFVYEDGAGRTGGQQRGQQRRESGGLISNSVLSPGVRVDGRSRVNRAVILDNPRVHRNAVVENTILDKDVAVLEGAR